MKIIKLILVLLFPISGYAQCVATDSFTGSGGLNASNWTNATGTTIVGGTVTALQIASAAVSATIGTQGMAQWVGAACTPPANQYSQITLTGATGGETGPAVRTNATAKTGYLWSLKLNQIERLSGMRGANQVAQQCSAPVVGHTYMLVVRGNWLYGYDNGTLVCQGADGVLTTGAPGIMVSNNQSPNTDSVGSFSAGSATLLPPVFSPYQTGTYRFSPVVTISNTSNSTICYTTDGTTPTAPTAGTCSGGTTLTYSSPITVSSTQTLTAISTAATLTNSSASAITLTIVGGAAKTYYVRPDGGQRFSTNITNGQCDGLGDASYVSTGAVTNATWQWNTIYNLGTVITDPSGFYETVTTAGTSGNFSPGPIFSAATTTDGSVVWTKGAAYPKNQHCAFKEFSQLYTDWSFNNGVTFPGWGWVLAGGDSAIIRGSIGTGVSYRVGGQNITGTCNNLSCYGTIPGTQSAAGPATVPSGGPSNHTTIFGENQGSCTSPTAKTQLHGGWGVGFVFNMAATSYVDSGCLDITDFAQCGGGALACTGLDWAGIGVGWSNTSTNDTMTDVHVHGLQGAGFAGPTGPNVSILRTDLVGNASSGWNADAGNGTTGWGALNITNFNISWNGCVEEYPIVDPLPYTGCTDDASGGYGDGFGTTTVGSQPPGWQVHFDQGTASYNTQDGLDALHISGFGSTMTDTRVLAYGNMGQQLKVGGAAASIQNSQIVGNCNALASSIPGTPAGFNSHLVDFCRAGDTAVFISMTPSDPAVYQDNTLFTDGLIGLEAEYAGGDIGTSNTLAYNNNVFVGFLDVGAGKNPAPIFNGTDYNFLTNAGSSFTHNVTFGQLSSWTCPHAGESAAICTTPGLVDMTDHAYGFGNMAPANGGSAVVGAGVTISGITTDFNGFIRPNPPAIGALEYTGSVVLVSITVTPNPGSTTVGGTLPMNAACLYSDSSTTPCGVAWTDTNNHSSINGVTGVVTGVSNGSDTVTATISTIFGQATVNISTAASFSTQTNNGWQFSGGWKQQ